MKLKRWEVIAFSFLIIGMTCGIIYFYLVEVPSESSDWYHETLGWGHEDRWSKERMELANSMCFLSLLFLISSLFLMIYWERKKDLQSKGSDEKCSK